MRLRDVIAPVTPADFRATYFGRQCFLVKRSKNPLEGLVSIETIEARLNDGVASRHGLAVIGPDGAKLPAAQIHAPQPGPAWSAGFVRKRHVAGLLEQGCSFVLHNMSSITPGVEELIREVEGLGARVQADVHIYVSPRANASGYNVHRDTPQHKLYIQLHGSTDWTVYKGTDPRRAMPVEDAEATLRVDFRARLRPGSVLYMPPGVFHRATNPDGPRISLSIPFYESPASVPVDRTPLRLRSLFEPTDAQ
ncbi:MAG: cupin domain-containing protein [Myxococcota bacterium]